MRLFLTALLMIWLVGSAVAENPAPPPATAPTVPSPASPSPAEKPARLGKVKVEGNRMYSTAFILRQMQPALKDGMMNSDMLERQLLLLNDLPDLHVRALLKPGQDKDTMDLVLKVTETKPSAVALSYDDFGNPLVGQNHTSVNWSTSNLNGRGDSLDLKGVVAFPVTVTTPFFQAAYTTPLGNDGRKLTAFYANGDFVVGQDLAILDIRGSTRILGLAMNTPLERSGHFNSDLTFSLTSKTFDNFILGGNPTAHDEIRSLESEYNAVRYAKGSVTSLSLSLTEGLGGFLGGSAPGTQGLSRVGASDDYTRANLQVGTVVDLGKGQVLLLRGSGQLTGSALLVGEQFSIGGPDSVRGFEQSEALGDSGYSASAEYRWPLWKKSTVQGALFLDTGGAFLNQPQPGEHQFRYLTGTGFGVRIPLARQTTIYADMGFPISPSQNQLNQSNIFYTSVSTRL